MREGKEGGKRGGERREGDLAIKGGVMSSMQQTPTCSQSPLLKPQINQSWPDGGCFHPNPYYTATHLQ